jgi:hypothetical protein
MSSPIVFATPSGLSCYLRDIHKYPFLGPEEEREFESTASGFGNNLPLLLRCPNPPALAAGDDLNPLAPSALTSNLMSARIDLRENRRLIHARVASY